MAWFGEGLSSLKGQITNFTKDIVATNVVGLGPVPISDNEDNASAHNVDPAKSHLEQLKGHCKSQDDEIEKLKEDNERLRRLLAKQSPRDRRTSEEATLQCEEVSGANAQLPLVPLDEAGTDSFLGQDHVPKDVKIEEEMSSLRSRLRKTFQEKVLIEQSCSRLEKEVALLTQQVTADRQQAQAEVEARRNAEAICKDCHQSTQTEGSNGSQVSTSLEMAVLIQENDRLKQERAQLRTELARMSRAIQDLESQVAVSQDENANLSTGMEELDIQHQEAIEQIMVLKDSTQKRYEVLLAEFEDLKQKYEKSKSSEENERNKNLKHSECQTNTDISSSVKSQILLDLSEEIKNMITTEIPEKYFETGKENASGLETVAAVEKMLSHTMARIDSSESKIRELLKELRSKDDEVQEIEEENKTLRMKIEELKEQCDNLPTIAENNEDVEAMENKIMMLENEISILREVRSNLEVEHNNSRSEIESLIRHLQTAEAMNRNQDNLQSEISKYKESEQELLKKLNYLEHSKEEMLSEMSHLQHTIDEHEKVIDDLKQSKLKLDELTFLNCQLQDELLKSKDSELKAVKKLQKEKTLRRQLEEENEKLFAERSKLESSEKHFLKQNIELRNEQSIMSQLQEEIALSQQVNAEFQDTDEESDDSLKKIESDPNFRKKYEEGFKAMHVQMERMKRIDDMQKRFQELSHQYALLKQKFSEIKDTELLYLKAVEELQQEKTLRIQLEEEKEKLFAELTKWESSEKRFLKQSIELQEEQSIRFQLHEENAQLQQVIAQFQDTNKESVKLMENLQSESNLRKQLEESLEAMHVEMKRCLKAEGKYKQLLDQQNHESDVKLKELKNSNACLTQKCMKLEKEVLDLAEISDGFKIEIAAKDRKLCEIILEKSVSDKELLEIKTIKGNLESQVEEIKTQVLAKEILLLETLNKLGKFVGLNSLVKSGNNFSDHDFHRFSDELTNKMLSLEQKRNQLDNENITLSENIKSLISEVNDKTECLFKLNAQIETLQAEKHSLEDRLRNMKETVSTGNQTDQPVILEISQESYTEVHKKLEDCENQYKELEERYKKLLSSSDQSLIHVNDQLRNLHNERQQLIETVQKKHAECMNYHTEIQRLCTELSKSDQQRITVTAQLQKQLEEKEEQLTLLQASSDRQVTALSEQIHTLQNQLDYVSQLLRVTDRQEAEGQPASDSPSVKTPSNKTETVEKETRKIDELYENLQQEQLRNKYLQDEVSEQHEKEAGLVRELQRLRGHLVLVEENYTQEMVRAEQQVQELNQRLAVAEERAKSSSTAYTSASIRANQQVESLGSQLRLLTEQKEKLSTQLAAAEDKLHKQAAALTNLQIVLEQFQRDKERDVAMENERIRQTLQQANNKITELNNEIKALQLQLKEAKEGLSAASRLTEQLDYKSCIIAELKQEVTELTEKLKKADERIQAASVSVEGKVDRCLVRNLVVGYICAPPSSRQQALGVIATVLDFTQDDRQRSGLDPNTKYNGLKQQSLSEAFVRFLENESRPQPQLRLPLQETEGSRSRKTSFSEVGLPPARRTSGSVLKDVLKQDL